MSVELASRRRCRCDYPGYTVRSPEALPEIDPNGGMPSSIAVVFRWSVASIV
jgi:hypothetical protein